MARRDPPDVLAAAGNPLRSFSIFGANPQWINAPDGDPIDTIKVIMKDGALYKNTLWDAR